MLMRDAKRLAIIVGSVIIFSYTTVTFYGHSTSLGAKVNTWMEPMLSASHPHHEPEPSGEETKSPISDSDHIAEVSDSLEDVLDVPDAGSHGTGYSTAENLDVESADTHHEVFSLSTKDKKFFVIDFGEVEVMNPNIIPHPTMNDTWIVVAQRKGENKSPRFTELVCNAAFQHGALQCLHPPNILPIAATVGDNCKGDLSYFNVNHGPHDARVFFGPENPHTVYGSNSAFTCFGLFVQDFRLLVDWDFDMTKLSDFRIGTELERPAPWGTIEKNWFLFWDPDGQMYAHYDVMPMRAFAQIGPDGSAGSDLAPFAADSDHKCLARYMPRLAPELESIHQATNSLQITMCKRADPSCVPDESNTFIFTIYQHKTFYKFHSVYEPYAMVFRQRAPFKIHALSRQPLWIHGREKRPERHTSDMFYVTSLSWQQHGQRYHGYLDDKIFMAFGIEDEKAGGIDVLASDLLGGLGMCDEL